MKIVKSLLFYFTGDKINFILLLILTNELLREYLSK